MKCILIRKKFSWQMRLCQRAKWGLKMNVFVCVCAKRYIAVYITVSFSIFGLNVVHCRRYKIDNKTTSFHHAKAINLACQLFSH